MEIVPIAYYHGPVGGKFGVPRQGSLVEGLEGRIVFVPPYNVPEALRGLDGFSRIWVIWGFSESVREEGEWSPTVRPPRLGGNERVGVWASRSPFRPNSLAISALRITSIDFGEPSVSVEGADLADGTPVYDIKPYIPYADAFPDERSGFAPGAPVPSLEVTGSERLEEVFGDKDARVLKELLSLDPRPSYQKGQSREYGMTYLGRNVRFRVDGAKLTITSIE